MKGESLEAKSVILATGAQPRKVGVKGKRIHRQGGFLLCNL